MPENHANFKDKQRYSCRITEQAFGKNKNGNPQLSLRFQVLAEVLSPTEETPCGGSGTLRRVFTPGTMEYAAKDLINLGYEYDTPVYLSTSHPQHVSLIGRVVDLYNRHRENTREDGVVEIWDEWSVALPQAKPLEETALDKPTSDWLNNVFGSALKKERANAGQQAAKTAPPPAQAQRPPAFPAPPRPPQGGAPDMPPFPTDSDVPF